MSGSGAARRGAADAPPAREGARPGDDLRPADRTGPQAPPPPDRLRAWLELLRLSNAPTCVTNALVGIALGLAAATAAGDPGASAVTAGVLLRGVAAATAILLLYGAGLVLNDLLDRAVDRRERPGRPIPSGRVSPRSAAIAAGAMGAAALLLLGLASTAALCFGAALAAAIVAYDLLHLRTAGAVVLMGACRALIYPTSAAAIVWPIGWTWLAPAVGLGLYVALLSVVARGEIGGERESPLRAAAMFLLPLVPLAAAAFVPSSSLLLALPFAMALVAWCQWATSRCLAGPGRVGSAVAAWIAGIALIDAVYLALLNHTLLALVALGAWAATAAAQRRIAGS
ncbi:MAG TPA: UbiA family prenyltransferase [Phycisphaerales bacterium]|nr:UbiA family prenyltransferase [Phycisphaerales bacterium]HMP36064.1 UbiA family prenyltransferase [Phycisphaerales bacterium]